MSSNDRNNVQERPKSTGTRNPPQPQNRRRYYGNNARNSAPQRPTSRSEMSHRSVSIDEHKMCICCLHELITYVYYSCMHYVCLQCAVKMRVVCKTLNCPACRQPSDTVMCTKEKLNTLTLTQAGCTETEAKANNQKDFDTYMNKFKEKTLPNGFYYSEEVIKSEFNTLVGHKCTLCVPSTSFDTFDDLYGHLKREHKRFYCDLCIDNLQLFTLERKFYTREELATHRRQGDANDKSFKGHPVCKFCDQRFFDRDELYKHLRKEHHYCHFCDADGCEEYYENYLGLRKHFLQRHFLCEQGECAPKGELRFNKEYVVFRREIDLKAHQMQLHAKSKSEAKALGKLNIEFSFANDARTAPAERRPRRDRDADRGRNINLRGQLDNYETENRPQTQSPPVEPVPTIASEVKVNISGVEPVRSSIVSEVEMPAAQAHWRNMIANGPAPMVNQMQEFPTLGGAEPPRSFVFQSLSTMGKSMEKSNAWAKKSAPKKEPKKVDVVKNEKKEVKIGASEMVDLKSYLSQQKEQETFVQIGKKKDEEDTQKEPKTKKPKAKKEAPPPGFTSIEPKPDEEAQLTSLLTQTSIKSPVAPPPGFAAPQPQPQPTQLPPDNYKKPDNYEIRNQDLANRLNDIFTRDKFEKFKQVSSQFRQSSIDAFGYLDKCRKDFFEPHSEDYRKFIDSIPDMVALLPNIGKQNELYDAFVSMSDAHRSKFRKLSKCHYCDQLMFANELTPHVNAFHAAKSEISTNEDFPTLGKPIAEPKKFTKVVGEDFPTLSSATKNPFASLSSIVSEDFPPVDASRSLKKAVAMNLIEEFPPLSSEATHRSTFSDLPAFHQQHESLIFNNPKENLSLVNKKKNRYKKFLK